MMGTIKPSKDQALVAGDSKVDSKSKKKSKNSPKQKGDKAKSQEESSGSKKNKELMSKCAYYKKGYHPESPCMKNEIDMLTQI